MPLTGATAQLTPNWAPVQPLPPAAFSLGASSTTIFFLGLRRVVSDAHTGWWTGPQACWRSRHSCRQSRSHVCSSGALPPVRAREGEAAYMDWGSSLGTCWWWGGWFSPGLGAPIVVSRRGSESQDGVGVLRPSTVPQGREGRQAGAHRRAGQASVLAPGDSCREHGDRGISRDPQAGRDRVTGWCRQEASR